MKLNLNFDKYKGVTRLREWWKEVKKHFEAVQTEHNALEDAFAAEVTQRTEVDVALAGCISTEMSTRAREDSLLWGGIDNEASKRTEADDELKKDINTEADTRQSELFGDDAVHIFKVVCPSAIPAPYFDGEQQYYGENVTVDAPVNDIHLYADGKALSITWDNTRVIMPASETTYVYMEYDAEFDTYNLNCSTTSKPADGYKRINLWTYNVINFDFTVSDESPTGGIYNITTYGASCTSPNADTTGTTYTVAQTYTARRTRDDLLTENKASFLDAVNENTSEIKTVSDKLKNIDVLEAESVLDEACFGEILKLTDPEVESIYSEVKIRRERDVDNKYPNAVVGNVGSAVNNADIFFVEDMGGTVNGLTIDDYKFDIVNPMSLPAESKVYFRVLERCISTIDGCTPGKVSIIDVYSWHDAIYIKTNGAEEYTKVAMKEDIDKEVSNVKSALPNIKKNPDAEDGDIVDKHMTVGTRAPSGQYGDLSFTSGMDNIASAEGSCAAGGAINEASEVDAAVLGGYSNTASGVDAAVLGGNGNTASGEMSAVVGGGGNTANNYRAVVIGGRSNIADGNCSVILGGNICTAKNNNVVFGHRNADPVPGTILGATGDAVIVGNGTNTDKSNAFRVAYNGNVYCAGEYGSTGADYAEMFEWVDGNPDNEDRRGLFAYIENGKMRLASANDTDKRRLGVISARPAVVGDNFDDSWCGKYLTDIYGAVLTQIVHHEAEEYTVMVKDPETGERVLKTGIIEAYDAEEPILNPDYDPEREYIPRAQRKEYDCWAFLGKLVVRDDGTCQAGGYCYPGTGGISTACDDESKGFYVMERLDETHIRVLIK